MLHKISLLFCALISLFSAARAATLPTVSTDDNEVWYLIQFVNGGKVINASAAGGEITVNQPTYADSEWFKVTGDASNGYTFTSKTGLKLFVSSAAKEQKVKAAASPSGVTRFKIQAYGDAFEVVPVGNTSLAINLWGGPSDNRGAGLWTKNDVNNAIQFVDASALEEAGRIAVIPQPLAMETQEGDYTLSHLTAITYPNDEVKADVETFAAQLKAASGIALTLSPTQGTQADNNICLVEDNTLGTEAYNLDVTAQGVTIKAATTTGFFYALQTLRQLLPRAFFNPQLARRNPVEWTLPYVSIQDSPLLGHRGFMMDVSRHFFSVQEVKRVLDIMALYKMNRLHWHLTDDQGWRIEIPEYPRLTEVGAVRSGSFTNPGTTPAFYDDTEYGRGMYYTQDQLREIVAYAAARHIEILPEIDLPGHMVAAIASYPELSCDPSKEYSVRLPGGISHDVLNVGKDEVIDFLKCVLGHVARIFPHPYIHIGGDECPTEQWANNADCLRRVQEEGLTGVNQLQSWLVEELGIYLKQEFGKDIVVWDELLGNWKTTNQTKPVVMAWNSIDKSRQAADLGMKSIVVPYQSLYLDMMQVDKTRTVVDEPYFGGWSEDRVVDLPTVYNFNPLGSLSGREDYCLGVQGNLWAETLNDSIELEYQLLPRMLAISEIGWLPNAKKNWMSFLQRIQSHDEILEGLGYTYAKHYFEPAELSEAEQHLQEAASILAQSIRGGVGFPAADLHDALQAAYKQADADLEDADAQTALATAIAAYKAAPITMPESGKNYRIVSQSTYYKKQYAGSTMYVAADGGVRFHYTPQTEPEELWQFEPNGTSGYVLVSRLTGKQIVMPTYGAAVTLSDKGTPVRIDRATIASGTYTYIPGSVNISAVAGYTSAATGSVKRLNANCTGQVYAANEPALCYPGTWRIEEVTDYSQWLAALCDKCDWIILTTVPGKVGAPSEAALAFLAAEIITPAREALNGIVDEATYMHYLDLYNEYLAMPRASILDSFDAAYYYRIQNAYFTNYYAALEAASGKVVPATLNETSDNQLWRIEKQTNGTVRLVNKANDRYAYVSSSTADATIYANGTADKAGIAWLPVEITTDQGAKGIAIVESTGTYSWYTNPNAFPTIILKPKDWGASIWNFQKSGITTGLQSVTTTPATTHCYDLSGRRITRPTDRGVYILNGRRVMLGR